MNRLIKYKVQPHYGAETQISKLTQIATVLAVKDPYTREHARRVAIYAQRLSERIGLNDTAVENIRLGGLLHDIGKFALCNAAIIMRKKRVRLTGIKSMTDCNYVLEKEQEL